MKNVYQQKTDKELNYSESSKKIIIPQGTYSVNELETLIKQHIPQFTLSLNKERTLEMFIGINTHMTFTKNMLKLIGIKEILEDIGCHLVHILEEKKLSNQFKLLIQYTYIANNYLNQHISSMENTPIVYT